MNGTCCVSTEYICTFMFTVKWPTNLKMCLLFYLTSPPHCQNVTETSGTERAYFQDKHPSRPIAVKNMSVISQVATLSKYGL